MVDKIICGEEMELWVILSQSLSITSSKAVAMLWEKHITSCLTCVRNGVAHGGLMPERKLNEKDANIIEAGSSGYGISP